MVVTHWAVESEAHGVWWLQKPFSAMFVFVYVGVSLWGINCTF